MLGDNKSLGGNVFLLLLAAIFMFMGVYFQWLYTSESNKALEEEIEYQKAQEEYHNKNIYYEPDASIQWLSQRHHPAGYYVPNPDLLFEPTQLNDNTLRATRYAISSLYELGAIASINRKSVIEYVFSNYHADLQADYDADSEVYRNGPYAGFSTLKPRHPAVRPTMDALVILNLLGALDDSRLDLDRVGAFITAHLNKDGGFWDEHYPHSGRKSSLRCTSFALRALEILNSHQKKSFSNTDMKRITSFVVSTHDPGSGGYADFPGQTSTDSYFVFRAFISLWSLTQGDLAARRKYVEANMEIDQAIDYLFGQHYLEKEGAFSRYHRVQQSTSSHKATNLVVWFMTSMGKLEDLPKNAILHFMMEKQNLPGEFGGDIYTTYSALSTFSSFGVPTEPMSKPEKPTRSATIPAYFPLMLFSLSLLTLITSYYTKKHEMDGRNRILARQASIDGLTGILNRKGFEEGLKEQIGKVTRHHKPLSLIMIDVDNFKDINDRHGHVVGDKILKEVTRLMTENIRIYDIFARWGGEEFTLLVTETNQDKTVQLAEKLRRVIIGNSFFEIDSKVTCSFGVAMYRTSESMEDFVHRADEAMYNAKHSGRNRVCTAPTSTKDEVVVKFKS
jgi:diguanylate cyclase (GGDEF)-like protein